MIFFVYVFLALAVLLLLFILWIHTAPLQKEMTDALIILGFQCDNDRIHPLLEERLSVALELMRSYPVEKIILTGGAVTSLRTEADIMKEYLLRNGVEEERIILDKEAMDTIQNINNCRKIMELHRLSTCTLISNSFHIRRVQYIANAVGFSSSFYADKSFRANSRQIYRTLHELKGFVTTYNEIKKR
ncbi:MAG: hypothetical protein K0Q73_5138 [Paenibacillus sp.]|jgi:uncharacterized SAM-binding protein YcdF (DUF218 family)|nr:hypothetical protein [Paenibacillus sp.]